jgi:RND family efflux transporter MFP subunit
MLSLLVRTLPILLAAILGGLIASWVGGHAPSEQEGGSSGYAPLPVVTVPLIQATAMETASRYQLGGVVEARQVVHLTAQQPGRVVFIAGREGDRVGAGTIVVALDDDALKPEYRSAWASLGGEMAAQQNAQTQLYQKLYGFRQPTMGGPGYDAYERAFTPFYNMFQNFMGSQAPALNSPPMMTQNQAERSPSAVNNARADYEREQAGLVAAQSRIDSLDERLRDRRSIAPFAAVIMARHIRVGDIVQPGQPLVDLANPDELDLRIEAPADLALNLKVGDKLPVSLDRGNVWAVVSQIFPGANAAQHTVTIKAALPPGTAAAPGMYGLAWIAQPGGGGEQATAPSIPRSAVVYRGSLPAAFVVGPDGSAEMRILRLGDTVGDRVAVLSGLRVGEQVVAHPEPDMKSGDPLTTVRR